MELFPGFISIRDDMQCPAIAGRWICLVFSLNRNLQGLPRAKESTAWIVYAASEWMFPVLSGKVQAGLISAAFMGKCSSVWRLSSGFTGLFLRRR
jgi:hypothetical protein